MDDATRPHRRRWIPAAAAAAGLLVLAATAAIAWHATRGDDGAFRTRRIVWSPCPGGGVECGQLVVPVDHAQPEGETASIAVARRLAADRAHRIGVLVILPGGPGVDGTDAVRQGALSTELRDRFDVVSYAPRGFSQGAELDCGFHTAQPPSTAAASVLRTWLRAWGRACATRGGALAGHLSAVDVARDVEVLRRSLGERRISLLGISYGTTVGAAYQALYPGRVRATVLDGAFDLTGSYQQLTVERYAAAERSLDVLLRRCARLASCPFRNGGRPRAALERLLDRLAAEPARVQGRPFSALDAEDAIAQGVIWDTGWLQLATALEAAQRGDLSQLAEIGQFGTRTPDASLGFACGDRPAAAYRSTPRQVDVWRRAAPLLARHASTSLARVGLCDGWLLRPTLPPPLERTMTPTLVVSSTGDTRTPLAAGRRVADALGAPLLVVRQFGHVAYTGRDFPSPSCVTRLVDAVLVDERLPRDGVTCAGDPASVTG